MTQAKQALLLAKWLDKIRHGEGCEPPDGVDSDVLEAVYALRPQWAPAPRVELSDILLSVSDGPLVIQDAASLAAWLEGGENTPPIDDQVRQSIYALRSDLAPPARVSIDDILQEVHTGPYAHQDHFRDDVSTQSRRRRAWMGLPGVGVLAAAALVLLMVKPSIVAQLSNPVPDLTFETHEPAETVLLAGDSEVNPDHVEPDIALDEERLVAQEHRSADLKPEVVKDTTGTPDATRPAPPAEEDVVASISQPVATPTPTVPRLVNTAGTGVGELAQEQVHGGLAIAGSDDVATDSRAEAPTQEKGASIPQAARRRGRSAFEGQPQEDVDSFHDEVGSLDSEITVVESVGGLGSRSSSSSSSSSSSLAAASDDHLQMGSIDIAADAPMAEHEPMPTPLSLQSEGRGHLTQNDSEDLDSLRAQAISMISIPNVIGGYPAFTEAISLAEQLESGGDFGGARSALEAFQDHSDANVLLEIRYRQATLAQRQGHLAEAIGLVDRGTGTVGGHQAMRARLWVLKGDLLRNQGDNQGASMAYVAAIEIL